MSRRAFLFPGQGAQTVGMGKDFYKGYPEARAIFDEADEILGKKLSTIIFEGPLDLLTQTYYSQTGIYVTSLAILAVINKEFPSLFPDVCAGLSLGEYTALTASGRIAWTTLLPIVEARGTYMSEVCNETKGAMAAIFGLSGKEVEQLVTHYTGELWVANFNAPQQTVISGTVNGVRQGIEYAKTLGAKKAIPLKVQGAFHSGLMQKAQERLKKVIQPLSLSQTNIDLVMNVSGTVCCEPAHILDNLIKQVTHSVCWEQGIMAMGDIDTYYEIGCGRVLAGLNRQIIPGATTLSINQVTDLSKLEEHHDFAQR